MLLVIAACTNIKTICTLITSLLCSGHGSLWRVEALRGADVNGKRYADPKDRKLVGKKLGFRSEMVSTTSVMQHTTLHCV
jgi:hypothetical protein